MLDSVGVSGALLRVRDVSVFYNGHKAVGPVSIEVRKGEVVGIAGPSAAGKTSLARAILGQIPKGASITGAIDFAGRSMAPVFQEPAGALHPMLRCGRQVEEVVRARTSLRGSQVRAAAGRSMEQAGLEPALHGRAFPHELSGGQRQRVLVAQAIAAEPDLIVADEPTAALDAISQEQVLGLLLKLAEKGTAIVLISHRAVVFNRTNARVLRIERTGQADA